MKTSLNIRMNQGFTHLGEYEMNRKSLKLKRFLPRLFAFERPCGAQPSWFSAAQVATK
jgi:hypothetical protein